VRAADYACLRKSLFSFARFLRNSPHLPEMAAPALLDDIPACAKTLKIGDPDVDHC
jgi:hypothetical protein